MQPCDKLSEIAEMKTTLTDIAHIVKGNGKPGLQTTMIQILASQENMNESVKSLATSVSSLVKFQTEIETEKRTNLKNTSSNRWLVTTIIALAAVIVTLIFK